MSIISSIRSESANDTASTFFWCRGPKIFDRLLVSEIQPSSFVIMFRDFSSVTLTSHHPCLGETQPFNEDALLIGGEGDFEYIFIHISLGEEKGL